MFFRRFQIYRWMPLATWVAVLYVTLLVLLCVAAGVGRMLFDGPSTITASVIQLTLLIVLPTVLAVVEYRTANH